MTILIIFPTCIYVVASSGDAGHAHHWHLKGNCVKPFYYHHNYNMMSIWWFIL